MLLRRVVFLILSAAPLFARGSQGLPEGNLLITDHYDRSVSLEEPAMRVVSLAPGITETLFALGYGNRLVGRTEYCDYPPECLSAPALGGLSNPDMEAVVDLDPDVVIASTHFPPEALAAMEALGLRVAVLMEQQSFRGVYDGVIRPVSELLGDRPAGEHLVAEMTATVEKAQARASRFPSAPKVYYVAGFGEGGDWTAGGDTFIGEMISMAGGENIAAGLSGWAFSIEQLVAGDPDIIILPHWAKDAFLGTASYAGLRAVREGRVFAVDENIIVRQGPRLAEGYAELVNIIGSVF